MYRHSIDSIILDSERVLSYYDKLQVKLNDIFIGWGAHATKLSFPPGFLATQVGISSKGLVLY